MKHFINNTALMIVLMGMLTLPIASLGVMRLNNESPVLSAMDERTETTNLQEQNAGSEINVPMLIKPDNTLVPVDQPSETDTTITSETSPTYNDEAPIETIESSETETSRE